MIKIKCVLFAVFITLIYASILSAGNTGTSWTSYRGNRANTGCGQGSGAKGIKAWELKVDGVCSTPVVDSDNRIYVAVRREKTLIYAINGTNGKIIWIRDLGKGTEEYVEADADMFNSSPAIGTDGQIYLAGNSNKLFALNKNNGKVRWNYSYTGVIHSSPVIGKDGTVYFGTQARILYAIDGVNGMLKWKTMQDRGAVAGSPSISDKGKIFYGSYKGLHSVDETTGRENWYVPMAATLSTPTVNAKTVYSRDPVNMKVYAVDAKSGKMKWEFKQGKFFEPTDPALGPYGTLYFGDSSDTKGRLFALSASTGKVIWRFAGFTGHAPLVVDSKGTVYAFSIPKLMAIDGKTGKVKWRLDLGLGSWNAAPSIGNNGMIYIGTGDGRIIGIK